MCNLWSLDFPNLYQLVSTVTQGSVTNDIYQTPFGVRTFQWDPNNGLFLNGKRVEIQGYVQPSGFCRRWHRDCRIEFSISHRKI